MNLDTLRMRFVLVGCVLAVLLAGCDLVGKQKTYASPQEAVDALIVAVKSGKTGPVLRVLGADSKPVIESGDPVQDRNAARAVRGALWRLALSGRKGGWVASASGWP